MGFDFDFFGALRRMKASREIAGAPVEQIAGARPFPEISGSIGEAGLALIKRFEGCARRRPDGTFEAYPDPASSLARTGKGSGAPWTIGWGATGPGIRAGTVWTQSECDARLARDLERFAGEVSAALKGARTTRNQFGALVSFHYNTGAIARATLTRLHMAGKHAKAAAEFAKWVHAGGRRLPGLVRRREAEAQLYLRPDAA